NLNITPSSNLKVTQNTSLSDAVNSIGTGSSDENQDLSYELSFETMSKFNSYLNFGVEARYRFLPLKYDLKLANNDGSYSDKNYDVEEKISYIAAKIYFDTKVFNLIPTFGISSEDTKSTNKIDGKSSNKNEVKILFGLNGRF
ncbi:MAG: hypothetical protein U9O56_09830, partial [Campylobacterota bacterium]|nr:hypothetical protein [Campylobacterota bacterium]